MDVSKAAPLSAARAPAIEPDEAPWALAPGVSPEIEKAAEQLISKTLGAAGHAASMAARVTATFGGTAAMLALHAVFPPRAGNDGFDGDESGGGVNDETPNPSDLPQTDLRVVAMPGAKESPTADADCVRDRATAATPSGTPPTDAVPTGVALLVVRRPYFSDVRFANRHEDVKTFDGRTFPAAPGDAILTQQDTRRVWPPVSHRDFVQTYDYDPCRGEAHQRPEVLRAVRMSKPFEVPDDGSTTDLRGVPGDYLVTDEFGASWAVPNAAFKRNYLIVGGFPGRADND